MMLEDMIEEISADDIEEILSDKMLEIVPVMP